jgi:hypothetical protein
VVAVVTIRRFLLVAMIFLALFTVLAAAGLVGGAVQAQRVRSGFELAEGRVGSCVLVASRIERMGEDSRRTVSDWECPVTVGTTAGTRQATLRLLGRAGTTPPYDPDEVVVVRIGDDPQDVRVAGEEIGVVVVAAVLTAVGAVALVLVVALWRRSRGSPAAAHN